MLMTTTDVMDKKHGFLLSHFLLSFIEERRTILATLFIFRERLMEGVSLRLKINGGSFP